MSYQLTDGIRKSIRIRETFFRRFASFNISPAIHFSLNLLLQLLPLIFDSNVPITHSIIRLKDINFSFSDAFGDPSSQLMDSGQRINRSLIALGCRCSFFTSSSCTTQPSFLLLLFGFSTIIVVVFRFTLIFALLCLLNFLWGLFYFCILFLCILFLCSCFGVDNFERFVLNNFPESDCLTCVSQYKFSKPLVCLEFLNRHRYSALHMGENCLSARCYLNLSELSLAILFIFIYSFHQSNGALLSICMDMKHA